MQYPLEDYPILEHGVFPRVLGRLRRRYKYPIEQVIQRITENPAKDLIIRKRKYKERLLC